MYQFSGQLDNAVAPVDSIFASVAFGDPGKFWGPDLSLKFAPARWMSGLTRDHDSANHESVNHLAARKCFITYGRI